MTPVSPLTADAREVNLTLVSKSLSAVRIVILGTAGSGKSTFARRLGQQLRVPVICLDEISQEGPDQTPVFRAVMTETHAAEAWVSDGNFAAVTFDIRLPRATLILWLECAKPICAWRAFLRVFDRNSGHRLRHLPRVLRFIWNFDSVNRPRIEALRLRHGPDVPIRHLTGDDEIEAFLKELRA